ncbi:beta-galactosidase trimerization domain-containing protein [candidate division KSB1 bacterium]|nr:beta-galactosidase trimerization domain-containing protein [candidate division KSB1 bacterium]
MNSQAISKHVTYLCLFFLMLVFAMFQPPALAGKPDEGRENQLEIEHELSLAFETPHTKWAKPYAGGKIRTLFITTQFQGCIYTREIIELLQRFDLDADAIYYRQQYGRLLGDNNPKWYHDINAGTKRAIRLLENPYDVYFVNHLELKILPETVRQKIMQAVKQGAGLVMVAKTDSALFLPEKKLDNSAALIATGDCYQIGAGRGVLLPARKKLEYHAGWETEFDYQMEQWGRAIFWAANRLPSTSLEVSLNSAVITRENLPALAITLIWRDAPSDAKLQTVIRRWDGEKIAPAQQACSAKNSTVKLDIPLLRAGSYHFDAFITSEHGNEAWRTVPFEITASRSIAAVELERDWGEVGEILNGSIQLSEPMDSGDQIRVQLIDPHGRVIARKDFKRIKGKRQAFDFRIESWMPMLLRVEAKLMRQNHDVAADETYFRVTKRHRGQYHFLVWNYPGGDLAPYAVASMAKNGVTAILQGGNPPLFLSAYNMSYIPYTTRICANTHSVTGMLDSTGILLGGCYNDHARMLERINTVIDYYKESRKHGVLAYSLGDENAVRASCLSPHCLKAYQEYLKEIYGTIQALNDEWETDYQHFEQIQLSEGDALPAPNAPRWFKTYYDERLEKHHTDTDNLSDIQIKHGDKNDEMLALQAENFARWYDRQAFQNVNYSELCKKYAAAFKAIDPLAWTGFEGTDSYSIRRHTTRSRQGGDVDLFVRELDYFGPYHGPANELIRSIAPPDFPTGNWIGYNKFAGPLLRGYWEQITNCLNTVQWWRWDNLEGYHGFLAPHFAPYPASKELIDDSKIVRDGLGTLLMKSRMQDDEIAMLYSLPSTYIAHFDGNREYGDIVRDHQSWFKIIHDSGLQFRFVTDRMLRLGEFDASHYKVLILPLAFAIGEEEASVIREFVRSGGTVIADVRTGIYDEHCKPLAQGVLDDVFGIRREGKKDAVFIDRLNIDSELEGQRLSLRWGNWEGVDINPKMRVDPAVKVSTGKPLATAYYYHFWIAGAPACIVNDFGKGRAVYLNFSILDAPVQSLIEKLFALAGISAQIVVNQEDGARPENLEITRWQNGDVSLVSLFGEHEGEVRVTLPQEQYVYDLKQHTVLVRVKQFVTNLRPNRASFFALLPVPAPEVELKPEKSKIRRGTVLNATVSVPDAVGKHAVRIRVSTPDGKPADWFDQVLIVDKTPVTVQLPFAFDDPSGKWKISAIDLVTNKPVIAEVTCN